MSDSEDVVVDQSKNGVKVIVYRSAEGTTAEADSCLGTRPLHSNPNCPRLKKGERYE